MSADLLGKAAERMRDTAKCGNAGEYPGRWEVQVADPDQHGYADLVVCEGGEGDVTGPLDPWLAEHIAAWQPDVAREVANLLEVIARDVGTSSTAYHAALAVARAFLGSES